MNRPPHPGWTFQEAIEATVPGSSPDAAPHDRLEALRLHLLEGSLIAYARFPDEGDELQRIPVDAWKEFKAQDAFQRAAEEHPTQRVSDFKIYPVLEAPVIDFLPEGGVPLRRVLDRFVLYDPEVVRLESQVLGENPFEYETRQKNFLEAHGFWHTQPGFVLRDHLGSRLLHGEPLYGPSYYFRRALKSRYYCLLEMLRRGVLIVRGEPIREIEPAEVPLSVWEDGSTLLNVRTGNLYVQLNGECVLRWRANMIMPTQSASRASEARIPLSKIVSSSKSVELSKPTTVSAERKCQKVLERVMSKNPSEKIETKGIWEQRLIREIDGLSKRGFARAWDKAIDETGATKWREAGAPPRPGALKQRLG